MWRHMDQWTTHVEHGEDWKRSDLAGLVCNKLGDDQCINPIRGDETGDTWEKRMGVMTTLMPEEEKDFD